MLMLLENLATNEQLTAEHLVTSETRTSRRSEVRMKCNEKQD